MGKLEGGRFESAEGKIEKKEDGIEEPKAKTPEEQREAFLAAARIAVDAAESTAATLRECQEDILQERLVGESTPPSEALQRGRDRFSHFLLSLARVMAEDIDLNAQLKEKFKPIFEGIGAFLEKGHKQLVEPQSPEKGLPRGAEQFGVNQQWLRDAQELVSKFAQESNTLLEKIERGSNTPEAEK